jgi:hypothetical protein
VLKFHLRDQQSIDASLRSFQTDKCCSVGGLRFGRVATGASAVTLGLFENAAHWRIAGEWRITPPAWTTAAQIA